MHPENSHLFHDFADFSYSAKKKCSWDTIRGYDVVLTTYGSLGAEFKRLEKFELKKANEKQKPSHYEMNKLFPLFSPGSIFHRIILDEAQVCDEIDVNHNVAMLIRGS